MDLGYIPVRTRTGLGKWHAVYLDWKSIGGSDYVLFCITLKSRDKGVLYKMQTLVYGVNETILIPFGRQEYFPPSFRLVREL